MSKHTPGPWSYNKCPCGHRGCTSYQIGHSGAEGMFKEADARLIAAAPDLLEALKAFNVKEHYIISGNAETLVVRVPITTLQAAAAAAAKAEGGEG